MVLIAVSTSALAQSPHGVLTGDEWRYTDHDRRFHLIVLDVFERAAVDLVSIPAGFFITWSRDDYAAFTGWSALVLSLMIGQPSADVQLQNWVHATLGRRGERFTLWTPLGDALIWAGIWAASAVSLAIGWFGGQPGLVEMCALMVEAFILGQVFEVVPKLLIGREGPMNGDGQARVLGPAAGVRLFPAGTPSGHAQTLYAMMGAVSAYWGNPWLTAALQIFGFAVCATLLVDDYHYASDLIWGAAMGWELGAWVVNHRAAQPRPPVQSFRLLPLVDVRSGTIAVTAGFFF